MAVSLSTARSLPFSAPPRSRGVRRAPCSRAALRAVAGPQPTGLQSVHPGGVTAGAAGAAPASVESPPASGESPPASGAPRAGSISGAGDSFRAAGLFLLGALTCHWWSGAHYRMGDPFNGTICAHLAIFAAICAIILLTLRALVTVALWLGRRR
ncbi:hypothetical protein ABPG77_007822 [Micractinium sp. CCAP 211/92]